VDIGRGSVVTVDPAAVLERQQMVTFVPLELARAMPFSWATGGRMRMPRRFKDRLSKVKQLPAGRRFETFYKWEREQNRKGSAVRAPLLWAAALLSAAVGVVLVFIPGPAVLFFAIAGAIIAMQSRRSARALDWTEVKIRAAARRVHRWWRYLSKLEKIATIAGIAMLVLGFGAAAVAVVIGS
jgi:hypothetical protein